MSWANGRVRSRRGAEPASHLKSLCAVEEVAHGVALVRNKMQHGIAVVTHLHAQVQLPSLLRRACVDVAPPQPRVEAELLAVRLVSHRSERWQCLGRVGGFRVEG